MSVIPGKIVLKSSTSKSLSDRFGEIAKKSTVENIRGKQRQESMSSIKNKRLAATMAKRLGDSVEEKSTPGRKQPVKTRLGLSLANRLGNQGRRGQQQSAGNMTTRTGGLNRGGSFRGRGGTRGRGGGRGGFGQRGTGRGGQGGLTNQRSKRGKSVLGGRGGAKRGQGKVTARGGRGRGRGGRGRGAVKDVSQAQLDKELDQYMSKTKSVLNADLDQYMNAVSK